MSASKKAIHHNLNAFLDTLAWSEGTSKVKESDDGYKVLFGGGVFQFYTDHPRKISTFRETNGEMNWSTAAGRYQILERYWDVYKKQLHLQDFSPISQDDIAIELIKECNAMNLILLGNFDEAVEKCRSRWASLPGAGYKQHENKLEDLKRVYEQNGGTFAA